MRSCLFRLLPWVLETWVLAISFSLHATEWKPVSPEEMSLKAPRVEKTADAEVLFWDVWVTDEAVNNEYPHTVMAHYVRVKIFTDHGKDQYGTVEIPYRGKTNIADIAGRTIKPDGNTVELVKDAIFNKKIIKEKGFKVNAKSFAMPAVSAGAIIEYRWKEDRNDQLANYVRLPFQFELPVERITYHIKPLDLRWVPFHMRFRSFNLQLPDPVPESRGYYAFTETNVPPFHKEPEMPPEDEIKRWALIYYEQDRKTPSPETFWNEVGREFYDSYKRQIKVNGEVEGIAAAATQGATTPDEKLAKLVAYCRKNLKNIYGEEATTEERERAKQNKTTLDTLRRGEGTPYEINLAFASLAIASGFDARLARLADRGDVFFDPRMLTPYFLNSYDIAVNVNGKWQLYDPANRDVPPGMLEWREEGVQALLTDPKDPTFIRTSLTSAEKSRLTRIGQFTLDSDGTLEGDVREIFAGHHALTWRAAEASSTPAEREEELTKEVKKRFASAEISDAKFTFPEDVANGAGVTYHIKIPGYAQRTGKRLFVTPAYFEAGVPARFPESKREYPVYFHYPWSEFDTVRIKLPDNYELDHGDAPGGIKYGPLGEYNVRILLGKDKTLIYERQFSFGANGTLIFDTKDYPVLKQLFDKVHEADAHLLTLKNQPQQPIAAAN